MRRGAHGDDEQPGDLLDDHLDPAQVVDGVRERAEVHHHTVEWLLLCVGPLVSVQISTA